MSLYEVDSNTKYMYVYSIHVNKVHQEYLFFAD